MNITDLKRELAEAIEGIDEVLIEQEAEWLFDELKYAVLDLEPAQGRQHVQNLLAEMRVKFDWEIGESGVSGEEERLLAAYDFALSISTEDRRSRYNKTIEHLKEMEGETLELSDVEQMFLLEMDATLYERLEEKQAERVKFLDKMRKHVEGVAQREGRELDPAEQDEKYRKLAEETKGSGFKREK